MHYMSGQSIRETWLRFFQEKGHRVEPGALLIPDHDPTLLWINAGVAALKKYMDGTEVPPARRITNIQKSIRTNDMEHVGYTARHHTFFEMMGCFSIGDYFKKEIIAWAYELLTSDKWFAMPADRLYFTYNPLDQETHRLWLKEGVPEDHLIPLEGNYWEIGAGPAGPNTEVFFDRGEKYDPEGRGITLLQKDIDNDRYVELWGIVFTQYDAVPGVKREDYRELPSRNIDTGAGLERFALVLQGAETNFDTDLFLPLIKAIAKDSARPYEGEAKIAYRVIADHLRALVFALSDGAVFANEGRGYILRRLLRRAMRFALKIGLQKKIASYVPTVIEIYRVFYPELVKRATFIASMIEEEEEKFARTLTNGEALLRDLLKARRELDGASAFRLYDTYGFPLDLTIEIAKEQGVTVDVAGFEKEMAAQRERARLARGDLQSMHAQAADLLAFKTPSSYEERASLESSIIALFKDGNAVSSLTDEGDVIFARTCFYAESGGQVADHGSLKNAAVEASVIDVIKAPNGQHLHHVKIKKGTLKIADVLSLRVDERRHELIRRNHSATHLLQSALVSVLGDHIRQMGSYVSDQYLRFDFTHGKKITDEELRKIEALVNEWIALDLPSSIRIMPLEEAKKLQARAFFSEKYGKEVRVVSFSDISREFCGGSHVLRTGAIGILKIVREEAIAAGVRRIEARTSLAACQLIQEHEALLAKLNASLGATSLIESRERLNALLEEMTALKKENSALRTKIAQTEARSLAAGFRKVDGIDILIQHRPGASRNELLRIGDTLKSNRPDHLIVLSGGQDGDLPLVVMAAGQGEKRFDSGLLVRKLAESLGGSGGGSRHLGNGRGKDEKKLQDALRKLDEELS